MAKTKASTKRSTTAKITKPKKKKATTKKKTPKDEVAIDRRRTDRRSKKADVKAESKPKAKAKASTKGKAAKPTKTKRKPSSKTGLKSKVEVKAEVKAESTTAVKPKTDSPKPERRKVQRRRQIDPTTCERDYSDEEIEFMHALDAYKRSSGRMFPTCSEILEVVRALGYIKTPPAMDTAATGGSSEQEKSESGDLLPVTSDAEFAAEDNNASGEHDLADDLIIAPTDFSSSDSIDVNLLS